MGAFGNFMGGLADIGRGVTHGPGGGWKEWLFGGGATDPKNAQLQDAGFMRGYIKDRLGQIDSRQAPQTGSVNINTGPQSEWRAREMALANQLGRVASGQEKGAGELAVGRQFQQGLAAQMAQQRMARGAGAGIAARAAARNAGDMTVNASGMAQQAALQDQGVARQLLAGVLGQGRGADIGLATSQAGLTQQGNLANLHAKLQTMGMNDQAALGYLSQMFGISQAEMAARLAQEQTAMQDQGIFGDLLQMGGALAGAYIGKPG